MTPIRKGSNPVKIPFAIKSSDRVFAAWANETRTAIRQLEARIPTANTGRSSVGGGIKPPFWTAISASETGFQVTVSTGYLIYQNATATDATDGVTGWIAPKINGVSIEDAEVQPLALPDVASWVYLKVLTDADGCPLFEDDAVTIEAYSAKQESVHHVRPSPSGGEEPGEYYFLLLQTEGNGGTPEAPRAVRRFTGNVELRNQLIEITNIGGKRELYKGYLVGPDDKHELRTIEQIDADGEPVIKPLAEDEEEGETIKWKTIKEGDLAQINVRSDESGDSIIVEGNGVNGSYEDPFGGRVDYYDGLVVSSTPANIAGANLNLEFRVATETVSGSGSWTLGSPTTVYFRNGLYLGLTPPDDPEGIEVLTKVAVSDVQSIA